MLKEGQEVRMVANAEGSGSTEASTSYGGRGYGRGGGRGGRGPKIYTCFTCGKEGHFTMDCPDKPNPKEAALALNMVSPADVCAMTRSESKTLAIEDMPTGAESSDRTEDQRGSEWHN